MSEHATTASNDITERLRSIYHEDVGYSALIEAADEMEALRYELGRHSRGLDDRQVLRCGRGHVTLWPDDLTPVPTRCAASLGEVNRRVWPCGSPMKQEVTVRVVPTRAKGC